MRKIVYKEDNYYYYTEDGELYIKHEKDVILGNIKHLNDANPIFHYMDKDDSSWFPVYYEYGNGIITKREDYFCLRDNYNIVRNYTLVNLRILENEDNI